MTFRHISSVVASMMADMGIDDSSLRGGQASESANAVSGKGVEVSDASREEKGAEAEAPASSAWEVSTRRSMIMVSAAEPHRKRRAPIVSAMVIDLGVEREKRHAASRDLTASRSTDALVRRQP